MDYLIGNAIVGQSGGPTSAINATLAGVIRGASKGKGIKKLYGMQNGIEGFLQDKLIDLSHLYNNEEALFILES
ncbi:MAG: phosphofructokinase, partial [Clostridia bacterium]|nr:phosphofructokinase [Clostridia bacterium]